MTLDLNWINLLILFGALQGFIFSVILFFNKQHPGSRFLGLFMLILAYNGFETFNWSSGLNFIFFDLFPFILIFGIGPGIYFYLLSLLYPAHRIGKRTLLLHFAVVIFQFCFRLITLSIHLLEINSVINTRWTQPIDSIYHIYSEPLSVVMFLCYLVAAIYKYKHADTGKIEKSMSKEGQRGFHSWIKALLICLVVLAVAWPFTVLAPYVFELPYDVHYYPIELGLVFFIYWIAMVGYHRTRIIHPRQPSASLGISTTVAETYIHLLQNTMENERLFLNPELNLSRVAEHTGIPAKTISAVLNQFRRVSFNDFINEYRVIEVQQRLVDPKFQHLTISAIAFEAGFNSQATFQRAFKARTGYSPKEYLNLRLKRTG